VLSLNGLIKQLGLPIIQHVGELAEQYGVDYQRQIDEKVGVTPDRSDTNFFVSLDYRITFSKENHLSRLMLTSQTF